MFLDCSVINAIRGVNVMDAFVLVPVDGVCAK